MPESSVSMTADSLTSGTDSISTRRRRRRSSASESAADCLAGAAADAVRGAAASGSISACSASSWLSESIWAACQSVSVRSESASADTRSV